MSRKLANRDSDKWKAGSVLGGSTVRLGLAVAFVLILAMLINYRPPLTLAIAQPQQPTDRKCWVYRPVNTIHDSEAAESGAWGYYRLEGGRWIRVAIQRDGATSIGELDVIGLNASYIELQERGEPSESRWLLRIYNNALLGCVPGLLRKFNDPAYDWQVLAKGSWAPNVDGNQVRLSVTSSSPGGATIERTDASAGSLAITFPDIEVRARRPSPQPRSDSPSRPPGMERERELAQRWVDEQTRKAHQESQQQTEAKLGRF